MNGSTNKCECKTKGSLGEICRQKRREKDSKSFCAIENNDNHIYHEEIQNLLKYLTAEQLSLYLKSGEALFREEKGCCKRKSMLELIASRRNQLTKHS